LVEHTKWVYVWLCFQSENIWSFFDWLLCLILTDELWSIFSPWIMICFKCLVLIWAWFYINYTSCYFFCCFSWTIFVGIVFWIYMMQVNCIFNLWHIWELFFVFSVRKQHCRLWRLVIGILKELLISFIANPSLKHLLILDTWRSYTIDIKVSNGCENTIETLINGLLKHNNQLVWKHERWLKRWCICIQFLSTMEWFVYYLRFHFHPSE